MPSYVQNPFAANPGAQSAAYATALRNYAPNKFAGSAPAGQSAMAPHLSQPIPLEPDILQAYRDVRGNPQASQYEQTVPDIEQLWRTSPRSAIFGANYPHNPMVAHRAGQLRTERAYAAMSPEEKMQEFWNANTQIA